MTYSQLKKINVKLYIVNKPHINTLVSIIQCFFKTKVVNFQGLEISKDKMNSDLIANFEEILPLLMESYNHWHLRKTYENLTFQKCIKILKHYLFYFGYNFEKFEKMIKVNGKLQKIMVYRIPIELIKLSPSLRIVFD